MLSKFAACFAVLAFLLVAASASAADREDRTIKDPRTNSKPLVTKSLGTGPYKGLPSFFKVQGTSSCTSSCCYATASCSGAATTSCSETGCYAACEGGSSSSYTCPAKAPASPTIE